MRRPIALLIVLGLLAACTPAATPTSVPAQPAEPAAPALPAAPAAPQPTLAPTKGRPGLRPPGSGGALPVPTLKPAPTPISNVPNVNAAGWITYRDQSTGLAFRYPPDWQFKTEQRASTGILLRLSVSRLNQPAGNNAQILVDVRRGRGDLFTWVKAELPQGSLMINDKSIEGGAARLTDYNASLAGLPAVFLFAPEHGSGTPNMAEVHVAASGYFYQFTYLGDIPDNKDNRNVYLQLLTTVTLTGTITSDLALPTTAFTN